MMARSFFLAVLLGLSLAVSSSTGLAQTPPPNPANPPATPTTQNFQGGTLGIDCDKPRRNPQGKLILGDDGTHRARCEADRVTALNYSAVVSETTDMLRLAFKGLPPPLWEHLADHLQDTTSDRIDDWRYADAAVITQLRTLSADPAAPPNDPRRIANPRRAFQLADYWKDGILQDTRYPTDWRGVVRARVCGSGPGGAIRRGDPVAVWLDRARLRDRWTPEMVQRTVRVWNERKTGPYAARGRIPDILTASGELRDARGNTRPISRNQAILDCFTAGANPIPTGSLVMITSASQEIDTGRRTARCTDTSEIGYRRLAWERRNGVFVVPENAIDANGNAHPQRGQPLLTRFTAAKDRPVGNPGTWPIVREADARFVTSDTCRPPRITFFLNAVDCPAVIAGQNVTGKFIREFRFREVQTGADPNNPYRITKIPVNPSSRPIRPNDLGVPVPAGQQPQHWEETSLGCTPEGIPPSDAPTIPPRVPSNWGYPDCETQHGVRFRYGKRQGYIQTLTYPPGWPKKDVEVRSIDDDCWGPVADYGTQSRSGPDCPAGWSGEIIEGRNFRWWDREWAVPDGAYPRLGRPATLPDDATVADAGTTWDAGNTARDSFHQVTRTRDWHVDRNRCTRPQRVSDTQTRAGPSCPPGQTGTIREARSLSWYNRDHGATPPYAIANRSVGQAAADYDANPSQAGLAWYERVTLTSTWRRVSNTCRRPPPPPRDDRSGGGRGGEGPGSYDTDGDGITDSYSPNSPTDGYSTGGIGNRAVGGGRSSGRRGRGGNERGESSGRGGFGGGGGRGGGGSGSSGDRPGEDR